jgi:hypothetical protein
MNTLLASIKRKDDHPVYLALLFFRNRQHNAVAILGNRNRRVVWE